VSNSTMLYHYLLEGNYFNHVGRVPLSYELLCQTPEAKSYRPCIGFVSTTTSLFCDLITSRAFSRDISELSSSFSALFLRFPWCSFIPK
ncbi:hypothetical protein KI387_013287, partial [Taxus chinensis]